MKIQIKHRFTDDVLYEAEATSVKIAIVKAVSENIDLGGANLGGANLRGANLCGANLGGANLRDANLGGANLGGANLRDANLGGANLGGANLRGANLGGANLRDANLGGANLCGANLGGANLRDANLGGANLCGSLTQLDFFDVLLHAPLEVPGLLQALRDGRVDGSVYEGTCACLVGTIANIKHCRYDAIEDLRPDANRPAERWFMSIGAGDTPENSQIVKMTCEWIEVWQKTFGRAVNLVNSIGVVPNPKELTR